MQTRNLKSFSIIGVYGGRSMKIVLFNDQTMLDSIYSSHRIPAAYSTHHVLSFNPSRLPSPTHRQTPVMEFDYNQQNWSLHKLHAIYVCGDSQLDVTRWPKHVRYTTLSWKNFVNSRRLGGPKVMDRPNEVLSTETLVFVKLAGP